MITLQYGIDHILTRPAVFLHETFNVAQALNGVVTRVAYTAIAMVTLGLLPDVNRYATETGKVVSWDDDDDGTDSTSAERLLPHAFIAISSIFRLGYELTLNNYLNGTTKDNPKLFQYRETPIAYELAEDFNKGLTSLENYPRIAATVAVVTHAVATIADLAYAVLASIVSTATLYQFDQINVVTVDQLRGLMGIDKVCKNLLHMINPNPAGEDSNVDERYEFDDDTTTDSGSEVDLREDSNVDERSAFDDDATTDSGSEVGLIEVDL